MTESVLLCNKRATRVHQAWAYQAVSQALMLRRNLLTLFTVLQVTIITMRKATEVTQDRDTLQMLRHTMTKLYLVMLT